MGKRWVGQKLCLDPEIIQELISELECERSDARDGNHSKPDEMRWAYSLMGLEPGADRNAIQTVFRKKINELHPGKYANLPVTVLNVLKEKTQELNRARDILLK